MRIKAVLSNRLHRCTSPLIAALLLAACGGGGGGSSASNSAPTHSYTVGGIASGLTAGESVVIQDNGGDSLTVSSNGAFTFPTALQLEAQYDVTIGTQPQDETCTVSAGTGNVPATGVTNVMVSCIPPPSGTTLELVYATNLSLGNISEFTADTTTGALTLIPGSPLTSAAPYAMVIEPKARFAYAVTASYVTVYGIDPTTGALSALPGSPGPYFVGATPVSITVDPAARFVLVANSGSNNISVFSISVKGTLTEVTGSPFAAGNEPYAITVDPQGKYVYVANATDDTVSAYTMDSTTGALIAIAGSPFATGASHPQSVSVDPSGASLYVADFSSSAISAFSINSTTGALTPIAGSPYSGGGADVAVVDRSGKFVYVADGFSVLGFTRDTTTGALTAMAANPFPTGTNGNGRASTLVVDRTGKFLYVLDNLNDTIVAFAIDPTTGLLSAVAGSPFALIPGKQGTGPTGLATSM